MRPPVIKILLTVLSFFVGFPIAFLNKSVTFAKSILVPKVPEGKRQGRHIYIIRRN